MPKKTPPTDQEKLDELKRRAAEKVARQAVEPTIDQVSSNPRQRSPLATPADRARSETRLAASREIALLAERRAELERNDKGQFVAKMSADDWETVLQRLANGDLPANIVRDMGLSRAAISKKKRDDAEFSRLYTLAIEDGCLARIEDTLNIANEEDGFTTGNLRRDELKIDTIFKSGKHLAPHRFGDKLQIDQRTISINIDRDDSEW